MGQNQDIACSVVQYSWVISMQEVEKKTITLAVDQHEAIVGLKRGKDTIKDVVDRLLDTRVANDDSITHLDTAMEDLETQMFLLRATIVELSEVMKRA